MGDISSFYTPQAGQNTALAANGKSAGALATGGAPGSPLGFLDLLLATLNPVQVAPTPSDDKSTTGVPVDPLAKTDTNPSLVPVTQDEQEIIAANVVLAPIDLPLPSIDPDATIDLSVLATTPTKPVVSSVAPETAARLSGLDAQLQAQLAAMTGQVEVESGDVVDPAALNDLVVGGTDAQTISAPGKTVMPELIDDATAPTRDIAAQLNAMTVGGSTPDKENKRGEKSADLLTMILQKPAGDTGYQSRLGYDTLASILSPIQTPVPTTEKSPAPGSTILTGDEATLFEIDLSLIDPDQLAPTLTASPVANAAAKVADVAARLHTPAQAAVHAVALHLQNLAQNRDTRSLTLQLNPPELGRMQIKMTYGKDKTVKADILIEKSDTYSLMKNDADALKNALSSAGLQADAGSLNFALADQGTFAGNGESANDNADGNKQNTDDVIGAIEIKASEEWSVDPATGIVRYNIVV